MSIAISIFDGAIPKIPADIVLRMECDDASQMIADTRRAALALFPDKELAYDLIWRPRFQRLIRERFRLM